ncbi:MAG TPA: ABC transporter permease [Vicinamibacterales bacterium]|nr:ABC transporter permease [Vicinamibacterales bacterium]
MSWLRRFSNSLRPGRHQREIEREIAFHVDERTAELQRDGLSADEARRVARRRFGNLLVQAERTRDVDVSLWLDALVRNVRQATRTLLRTPGFTVSVVLTLSLGIGANTAVFSAIDAILLRALPFPESDRLVRLSEVRRQTETIFSTPSRIEDWNRLNSTFEAITGYSLYDATDSSRQLPERTRYAGVGPRFLQVLGLAPALGRDLDEKAHVFGTPTTLLVSDRFWRDRLGADPAAPGRTVRAQDVTGTLSFDVAGVMPHSFVFPDAAVDNWSALKIDAPWMRSRQSSFGFMTAIGRLKPGVTLEQARADLSAIQQRLGEQYPDTDREMTVAVTPLKDVVVRGVGRSLWMLFAAVSVLLLIACTNIATLLLARGAHREQEVAVRYSLGASRRAIAGQLLTEATLLSIAGAAAGLLLATGTSASLRRLAPGLPRLDEIGIDGRILIYTIAVAVVVSLICGAVPALRSSRGGEWLARGGGARVAPRHALQWVLVGVQVALSVTLLIGAGLLLRSFERLTNVEPGFDPSHVLAFRIYAPWSEQGDTVIRRVTTTLMTVGTLPGIEASAITTSLSGVPAPGAGPAEITVSADTGAVEPPVIAEYRVVSPSYFATMRIAVMAGDLCKLAPTEQARRSARQAMVNRAFADRYFAGRSVMGLQISPRGFAFSSSVVGIVVDAREAAVDREPTPTVYVCDLGATPNPWYLVRAAGGPGVMVNAVRVKLKEVEPLRAVYDIAPLEQHIGRAYVETRLRTVLLVLFAVTALSLACLGVYGTLSYVVGLKRREVGLRLALGAARVTVLRHFLTQGLVVVGVSSVSGLVLAAAFNRLLSGMLFGVSPSDPLTVAGVLGIVILVATVAALIPAARAALAQPAQALRAE